MPESQTRNYEGKVDGVGFDDGQVLLNIQTNDGRIERVPFYFKDDEAVKNPFLQQLLRAELTGARVKYSSDFSPYRVMGGITTQRLSVLEGKLAGHYNYNLSSDWGE